MPKGIYKHKEHHSPEHRQNISKSMKGKMPKFIPLIKGEKHYAWKGGVTPIYKVIRKSAEYKLWRNAVFARDNYTCIWCGTKDKTIKADHIKPFALYPELRFAIDNGRTLCDKCHRTTDTYGNRQKGNEVESDIDLTPL